MLLQRRGCNSEVFHLAGLTDRVCGGLAPRMGTQDGGVGCGDVARGAYFGAGAGGGSVVGGYKSFKGLIKFSYLIKTIKINNKPTPLSVNTLIIPVRYICTFLPGIHYITNKFTSKKDLVVTVQGLRNLLINI